MTHLVLYAAMSAFASARAVALDRFHQENPVLFWAAVAGFGVLILLVIGLTWGILLRRRAERKLRDSERLYRLLAENAADLITLRDAEGRYVYVSPSSHLLTGLEPEELKKLDPFEVIHPEDVPPCRAALAEALEGRDPGTIEYRVRAKDGRYLWFASKLGVLADPAGGRGRQVMVISRDVTERKQAEEELLREKRFSDALFQGLPGIALAVDRDRRVLRCNRNLEDLLGIPADEIVGRHAWELISEKDREDAKRASDVAWAEGRAAVEVNLADRHGREVPLHCAGVRMGTGEDAFVVMVGLDISDRQRAEDALRESEVRYRALFEFSGDGIFVMEGDYFVDCNERVQEMLGVPREQIIGASPWDFSPPRQPDGRDTKEEALAKVNAVLTGEPQNFEWQHLRADGTLLDTEVALTKVDLEGRRMILASVRDITDRKRAQAEQARLREELHQAQKMEAVGELAGGAAHDFNNLLTVILGNAGLAKLTLPEDSSARPLLDQIAQAAERASALTRSLLTFGRRLPAAKERIDLRAGVRETSTMLDRVLPASVELVVEGTSGEPLWVQADPTQIQQILMNLAVNARDAMAEGGTLRIAASGAPDAEAPEKAVLTVADTGVGMSPEVRSRIFEPFFTTKPRGEGTGLGLSIVHGIVADHGGRIDVESASGEGSTFTVTLPIAPAEEGARPSGVPADAPLGRGEQLLLAEDNPLVADAIAAMLRSLRYEVTRVPDGEALLDHFTEHAEQIRLLVVDIDLPKRSGLDVLREIRAGGSTVPVIIVTGTAGREVGAELDDNTVLLPKPFELRELADAVDRLLSDPPNTGS
ncbi:MAG: PAS domain S-box protein [Planctomycetota bacterium]|jgi:PAS domain S-box-containing protein